VLIVLGFGQLLGVVAGPGANTLIAAACDKSLVVGTASGVATLLLLGFPLASRFGAVGLAAASATGFVLSNLIWWWRAKQQVGLRTDAFFVLGAVHRRQRSLVSHDTG
jgi:O-antigen/teichoic acid export membrane protein